MIEQLGEFSESEILKFSFNIQEEQLVRLFELAQLLRATHVNKPDSVYFVVCF